MAMKDNKGQISDFGSHKLKDKQLGDELYDAAIKACENKNPKIFEEAFEAEVRIRKNRPYLTKLFKKESPAEAILQRRMDTLISDLEKNGKPKVSQFIRTWMSSRGALDPKPPSADPETSRQKPQKH